nr:retrotransposon protein, putative, Ty1-copia subclass [Tanacetum cinerariifolium]
FEKIDSPFQQTSSLKPYVLNMILEKIIIDLEDEVVNLLEKEKVNLETIESLKSKYFELSENISSELENQSENDCLAVEKECDKEENPKVIAPRMFKLSLSQCVSPITMSKSSCESNNVKIKLKRKRRKRKSSKQNVKHVDNDILRANSDFVHFSDLDTFSSDRRPKNNGVIWKKKGSSNTSNVGLSAVSVSNLNKMLSDILAKTSWHMRDLLDDNNFFIFDDENVKISPVSKMPFRKMPCDSMNVRSKSNMIKYLPRIVHGVDLLTGDRSLNLYTIALNEAVSNSSTCLLAKASSWEDSSETSQVQNGFCFKQASLSSLHGFVWADKTQVNLQLQVQRVRTDNGTEFKNKTLAKFFDEFGITQQFSTARTPQQNGFVERRNRTLVKVARTMLTFANLPSFLWAEAIATIMKSSTTNVETPIIEEVFHEDSKSFQGESSSSSLNDDVQQTSTLHNVFNERLKDAYFDASTSFYDPSNVHTYYQPYPHEKKWTKDHPLHKIIGDPKSSVRTRGQLVNSCLFSCLLNSIEPANVAEALRDADWVSAMQEELDQFASKQYPDHVYALDKALYGLKQVPRATRIDLPRSLPSLLGKLGLSDGV